MEAPMLALAGLLMEGYREARGQFLTSARTDVVDSTIATFKSLVTRNQVEGNESNIDWWRKRGWDEFKNFVDASSQIPSTSQLKRRKNVGRAVVLSENHEWLIVVPLDKDASCFHGKNTDWCTTKPFVRHYEKYFHTDKATLIYFCRVTDGSKWALVTQGGHSQFFDRDNKEITPQIFSQQTSLDPNYFIDKLNDSDIQRAANAVRTEYDDAVGEVGARLPGTVNRDVGLEAKLWKTKSIPDMVRYCIQTKTRWDKLEQLLLGAVRSLEEDRNEAIRYADKVVRVVGNVVPPGGVAAPGLQRWDELERALVDPKNIAKPNHIKLVISYVNTVIKEKWFVLEMQVLRYVGLKNSTFIPIGVAYARDVLKERWHPFEIAVDTLIQWSVEQGDVTTIVPIAVKELVNYTRDLLKEKWNQLEMLLLVLANLNPGIYIKVALKYETIVYKNNLWNALHNIIDQKAEDDPKQFGAFVSDPYAF